MSILTRLKDGSASRPTRSSRPTPEATALLLVALACSTLGCEPPLDVSLTLPTDVERAALVLEVSAYAPTDPAIDCDAFAWGDVDANALRGARVVVANIDGDGGDVGSVPRDRRLLLIAEGGDSDAQDLVGCADVEAESEETVTIEVQRKVAVALVNNGGRLGARLDATGVGRIAELDPDTDAVVVDGVCLLAIDANGNPAPATIRGEVRDARGALALDFESDVPAASSCVNANVVRGLQWSTPGPFRLHVRARFSLEQNDSQTAKDGLAVPTQTKLDVGSPIWVAIAPGLPATLLVAEEVVERDIELTKRTFQNRELVVDATERHLMPNAGFDPVLGFISDGDGAWWLMLQKNLRVNTITRVDGTGGQLSPTSLNDPFAFWNTAVIDASDCENPVLPRHHAVFAFDKETPTSASEMRVVIFRDEDPVTATDYLYSASLMAWRTSVCLRDAAGQLHRIVHGDFFTFPGIWNFDGLNLDEVEALPTFLPFAWGSSIRPELRVDEQDRAVLAQAYRGQWELSRHLYDEELGLVWQQSDAIIDDEPDVIATGRFFGSLESDEGIAAWSAPGPESTVAHLWIVGGANSRAVGAIPLPCTAPVAARGVKRCQLEARDIDDDGADEIIAISQTDAGTAVHVFDFSP